jgi:anti-sigma factor RsiW
MSGDGFEIALIPYLRGELASEERLVLEAHLVSCASCRDSLEAFRGVLAELRSGAHEPPEIDWRRYRAELYEKREARASRPRWWTIPRLVPIVVAAAASLALLVTLRGGVGGGASGDDMPVFEQTALGSRLDLLENYGAIENLDLLEDLDFVQELDDTAPVEDG